MQRLPQLHSQKLVISEQRLPKYSFWSFFERVSQRI